MRVDLRERIAGQSAAKVREFLRRAFDGNWGLSYVAKKLRVDLVVAEEVVTERARRERPGCRGWTQRDEKIGAGGLRVAAGQREKEAEVKGREQPRSLRAHAA